MSSHKQSTSFYKYVFPYSFLHLQIFKPYVLLLHSYTSQTIQVHVNSDVAVQVNFTLSRNELDQWSQSQDFQIRENLLREYKSNKDLLLDMENLAKGHSSIMEVERLPSNLKRSASLSSDQVYLVHLSTNLSKHEDEKPHVLLVGGFSDSRSPVPAQILTNFIRHQVRGE